MLASEPTNIINQLTAIFNANNSITAWVHALENAVIQPLNPAPPWYERLNSSLKISQRNSMSWITTTSPQLHAKLSQSFIDYNNTFSLFVRQINSLIATILQQGNIPTQEQQEELATYVKQLLNQARKNQQIVQGLQGSLNAYRTQMSSDHNALATAMKAAIEQEDEDREAIQQVQQQIGAIQQQITKDTTKADNSTVSYGTAIFSVIVGLTFGLAFAGGVLVLGGFATAILSIGSGFTLSQIYSNDLKKDLEKLTELMGELADDKQQLAMVHGIVINLQSLLDSNDQALQTFASITNVWDCTVYNLEYLLVVLVQPQIDVSKIPDLNDLSDAATAWQQIAAFAQKVQDATLQQHPPINLPPVETTRPNLRLVK